MTRTAEERFFRKVALGDGDCWNWTAYRYNGYGKFGAAYTHRWSWEFFRGEIPEGLQIDHLCHNRSCVNPDHLEPVTQTENIRRSFGGLCRRRLHRMADTAWLLANGNRLCGACGAQYQREYRAARRAAA